MATFAKSLESKLKSLEATQTGIQTLSLWIIHHRHHANIITEAWRERVKKVPHSGKRLGLFYLANDVVQNGRKKAKDLVLAFGKAFYEVMPLYSDEKTKAQVERVFNIWIERNVYDAEFIVKLRTKLEGSDVKPAKPKSPLKPKPKPEVEEKKKVVVVKSKKVVPPDFRVANLLVSIKKSTSWESEVKRKSKKLDNLRIDASSYDSVKHVKDRSSVGKFHKQFEESKIILDDYIHTLRRTEKDKRNLMTLLTAGEAFYSLARDEAKVIVNAYNTFGNRLHSMKRKLDTKIKKMEGSGGHSPQNTQANSASDQTANESRNNSAGSIQDMDLDSDSGDDVPASEAYNPSTAPSHDDSQLSGEAETQEQELNPQQQQQRNVNSITQSDFFNSQMNGMTSFLPSMSSMNEMLNLHSVGTEKIERSSSVTTPLSDISMDTPDGLIIADDPFSVTPGFVHNAVSTHYSGVYIGNSIVNTSTMNSVRTQQPSVHYQQQNNHSGHVGSEKNPAVQNLIDSLFPVLSKSLQTIKEKTQAAEEKPSVSAAMAFALGVSTDGGGDEICRKKQKLDADGSSAISPVSLTNPKGLSEHQEELINIAAGLTEFDENFLPVTKESSLSRSQSFEDEQRKEKSDNKDDEKKRDEKRSGSSSSGGRHRHRSHKDSSSHSPQRRSSHRSSRDSKDGRDERKSTDKRRSSRHSPSPRRRRGSRGGRSSSKERGDEKRRHSPEPAGKNVYYNNRRSPTPEMDSSTTNTQFPQQNIMSGQQQMIPGNQQTPPMSGAQPVIPGQPPIISASQSLLVNPMMTNPHFQVTTQGPPTNGMNNETNEARFYNSQGIVINPPSGLFSAQSEQQNKQQQQQQQQDMHVQENNNNNNKNISIDSINENNILDQSQTLLHSQQTQPSMGQMTNNFHLEIRPPGMIPAGQMNFNMNIRPTPPPQMGVTVRSQNPLHLLQHRIDNQPRPLRFQQLGPPRMIAFNQPHSFGIGVGNQDNVPKVHGDNIEISEQGGYNNRENDGHHQKIEGGSEHQDQQHQHERNMIQQQEQQRPQLLPPPFDVNNPPPFPGAPPVPPPFIRPSFPQPANQEAFNPGMPRFVNPEMLDARAPHADGMLKLRPGFGPDHIRANDSVGAPSMDVLHNNPGGGRMHFNAMNFEPRHDMTPQFRPRFNQNLPGRPHAFRQRTGFMRPSRPHML